MAANLKGGENLKKQNFTISKRNLRLAIRIFSLSIGFTAIAMLITASLLNTGNGSFNLQGPQTIEASAFNEAEDSTVIAPSEEFSAKVIPMGSPFGIKLFTDGVIVASLSQVYTENGMICPAAEAGIKAGDYILEANGSEVSNNSSLAKLISGSEGRSIQLKVKRGEEIFDVAVTPVFSDGSFKAGMWIRDSAAGIGTLTFYNPDTNIFAGLGHAICDMDTNGIMTLKRGEPAPITISGIERGQEDKPGQLQGYFSSDTPLGELLSNNETGLYGKFQTPPTGNFIEVARRDEVKVGTAQILASIDSQGVKSYSIEIDKIFSLDENIKNFVIRITDESLIEKTGGIVQGMSGCPIIQEKKLVGAVTHVFTDDPTTGYGIFAQTMVEKTVEYSMSN